MIKHISTQARALFFLMIILLTGGFSFAQQEMPLYNGAIPNATGAANEEFTTVSDDGERVIHKVSVPTLTAYLPPKNKANGTAVIICPGGGYGVQVSEREGSDVARKFNELGVAAFVLKYRLPSDRTMKDKSIGPLQDAQRAIQLVRENAGQWQVDPHKVGIMGFSAGGHLASTAGTHYRDIHIENKKAVNLRPDFMLLVYPVISFNDSIGHQGTRKNLLGDSPSFEHIRLYSNDLQVNKDTPPVFLTHAGDDSVVPVANSLAFYTALQHHSVPAGLFIYAKGEHGYLKTPPFNEWFGRCVYWMTGMQLLP